jgi:hypothetical protein
MRCGLFQSGQMDIPALTTSQMVEVDRLMVEAYGISLEQMMDQAGGVSRGEGATAALNIRKYLRKAG